MKAVCIGNEAVEGVVGIGIGIFFGVLFSWSSMETSFEGDAVGVLLGGIVLCNVLFGVLSSPARVLVAAEEMGERAFRTIDDSISHAFAALPVRCFFNGF